MERDGGTWAVLGGLYRGAVDPVEWVHALDSLTHLFRGELAVVEIRQRKRPDVTIETSSVTLTESVRRQYNAYYGRICPRAALLRDPAPRLIMHDDMVGDEAALDRDEYHVDFLAPQGLRYFIACRLKADARADIVLSIQRARAAGRMSSDMIERFERTVPYIADAYTLRLAFGAVMERANAFDRVIERLDVALILLDGDGRPLYVSTSAERLFDQTPGLALKRDGLSVDDPGARSALLRLLARTVSGGQKASPGGVVPVPGSGVSIRVIPLDRDSHRLSAAGHPAAAVIVERRSEPGGPGLARLSHQTNLTRREAEISLLLAEGASPREIAAAQGLRLSTVRTHIARARTKLDARTIADLVRTVLKEKPD